jgi:hypothetical protein
MDLVVEQLVRCDDGIKSICSNGDMDGMYGTYLEMVGLNKS